MEQSQGESALTDQEQPPATQCPHCASRVLFWWNNPKGHTVTWFCPACRMVKTRALSGSSQGRVPFKSGHAPAHSE